MVIREKTEGVFTAIWSGLVHQIIVSRLLGVDLRFEGLTSIITQTVFATSGIEPRCLGKRRRFKWVPPKIFRQWEDSVEQSARSEAKLRNEALKYLKFWTDGLLMLVSW